MAPLILLVCGLFVLALSGACSQVSLPPMPTEVVLPPKTSSQLSVDIVRREVAMQIQESMARAFSEYEDAGLWRLQELDGPKDPHAFWPIPRASIDIPDPLVCRSMYGPDYEEMECAHLREWLDTTCGAHPTRARKLEAKTHTALIVYDAEAAAEAEPLLEKAKADELLWDCFKVTCYVIFWHWYVSSCLGIMRLCFLSVCVCQPQHSRRHLALTVW